MDQEVDDENKEQEEVSESKNERRLEFNLLLLPILAIQNCLRFLELLQFIDFSSFSKRTKFLASTIHREKIEINLKLDDSSMIHLAMSKYLRTEWLIDFVPNMDRFQNKVLRTINGRPVQSLVREEAGETKNYHRMIFPKENVMDNIKWFAEHLKVVLRSPIKLLTVNTCVESELEIFKWLRTVQSNIDSISISGKQTSSQSYSFILREFRVKKELALRVKLSDDGFMYNQPINVHTLFVRYARWITMDSILASENTMIGISDSCFTSSDLNCFIKTWIGGWNKELEFFQMTRIVENYKDGDIEKEFQIITEGIEYETSTDDSGRPKFVTLPCGKRDDLCQGAYSEMKRNDGKRAAFLQTFIQRTEHIDHDFIFLTW